MLKSQKNKEYPLKTKLVCTVGPSCSTPQVLREMIAAGMSVCRQNFSHGDHQEHYGRLKMIREVATVMGKDVKILQDLEGFRIRLGRMAEGVPVKAGDAVTLSNKRAVDAGHVPLDFQGDLSVCEKGAKIFIEDGKYVLEVQKSDKNHLYCTTVIGGLLQGRKGVNIPALDLCFEGITSKDITSLGYGVMHGVDLIAQSFVRTAKDVIQLRDYIGTSMNKPYGIVSKIECESALADIDNIIDASDMIMVARGDLGVVIPIYQVPFAQKEIIKKCHAAGKPVITATQMLESMTDNYIPTRAEVADVANAVLDGTDYIMTSGETAKGKYPIETVKMMASISRFTESYMRASKYVFLNDVGA
jgi:pyruvate kinase